MYKINIRPLQERKELIKNAINGAKEKYSFYEYQNKRHDLPVVRLELVVPVYRLVNFRTRTAQMKYMHDHNKPVDFFNATQENESVQQAQHDILVIFAKDGRAASVSPIFDELKTEDQREPLIITSGGIVVNGNRRLAAMRELFIEQPADFRHFSHVDCAVLPANVTPEEVKEIEIRLQMRPETKLPYGWVNESIAIKELLNDGRKIDYIVDLMKKKKKDIERAARALNEADIYLKEWLQKPGEYQFVEDAEQFFNDLAKAIEGKQSDMLESSRRIAWVLLANSDKLNSRIYNYNFSFSKRSDEVISSLVDRFGINTSVQKEKGEQDIDELDIDLDNGDSSTTLEPLIELFDDSSQRQVVSEELIAVCDCILEQDKQGEIGRRALDSIQAANGKLQEVDLSKADPSTYNAINTQLESVIQRASKLKEKLQIYKSGNRS